MTRKRKNLGFGFPDEVAKVTSKAGLLKKEGLEEWKDVLLPNFKPDKVRVEQQNIWSIVSFAGITLVLFFILFLRLFHLQITEGKANRDLADGNRIQIKIIHAPRGVIFDRNGKTLAANAPAFRVTDLSNGKTRLISREEAMQKEADSGTDVASLEIDNVRSYPMGEKFAHILGYVGQISEEELAEKEYEGYRPGDRIGKSGLETIYEKILRGTDGGEIIEVDSTGKKLRTLRTVLPRPGQNIYLSVEADLQDKIYQELQKTLAQVKSCCAAAVAVDPGNGKILALVSLPSYDPNLFTQGDEGAVEEVFSNPASPILNRAISGTYPPGSTFKIVSSLAVLDSGKIAAETTFQDNGVLFLGPYKFSNWYFNQYGKTEGLVNLTKALQRSNDTYFYHVAQILGADPLVSWSRKLYLGSKLGIDLPGEESGLVPDGAWKEKTYGQVWFPGDTLHMSIGQGFVLTTPLQVLGYTSYIAANGVFYIPQLILSQAPKILTSNLLPEDKIEIVKRGLEQVPKEGGTAWPFFAFPITTAGKTGTAEYGDPAGRTHAWYTSYAPSDDPKIAMTVLIEGGGEGSSVAAPVAKEVYRWYFSPDKNNLLGDVYSKENN